MQRISPTDDLTAVRDADLVIEAVFEDLDVKSRLWRELDRLAPPTAVFASNTSSISIDLLASAVSESRRERFVGMHFFSPVPVMPLVELIRGAGTSCGHRGGDRRPGHATRKAGDRLGRPTGVPGEPDPHAAACRGDASPGRGSRHGRGYRRRSQDWAEPSDGTARAGRLHRAGCLSGRHARARRGPRLATGLPRRQCSSGWSKRATSVRRQAAASTHIRECRRDSDGSPSFAAPVLRLGRLSRGASSAHPCLSRHS